MRILSGIFEGVTTGTSIGFIIENENQHSADYGNIKDAFRPSHADYTYTSKYGLRDYRGGGRSSARETAARVVAGAFARQALAQLGITPVIIPPMVSPLPFTCLMSCSISAAFVASGQRTAFVSIASRLYRR